MATQQQLVDELARLVHDVTIQAISSKSIRVETLVNSVAVRKQKTAEVVALFSGASTTKERPHDVKLPSGYTILVKPKKGSAKVASGAFYGNLEKINLSAYDLSRFSEISSEFASGKLVTEIKEASDIKCVSELNEEIVKASLGRLAGITLEIHGFTFKNVIGAIPVTNGEPKADVVLVCVGDGFLYPDCYMSYKMGTRAKDFQNYSGVSEKSSPYIFNHQQTLDFYKMLETMTKSDVKGDVFMEITDQKIIGLSVWGSEFGVDEFGINNCHFIAQGNPSISGTSLSYTYSHKNNDFDFDRHYQPVLGARYATGRGNKGPCGIKANNFRIGIFARAYRTAWVNA